MSCDSFSCTAFSVSDVSDSIRCVRYDFRTSSTKDLDLLKFTVTFCCFFTMVNHH